MFRKTGVLFVMLWLLALLAACAPAAAPTATPTKAPAAVAPSAPAVASPPTTAPAKTAEPAKPTPAPSTPRPASVKISHTPSAGYAPLYLAIEKGYFKEQGIDAEMVSVQTPQEALASLGTGQLDVSGQSVSPALLAAADRGVDLKIVAAQSESSPTGESNWIMLRKDLKDSGQVKTVADLKGMKVALQSQGGIAEQTIQLMLEGGGLKRSDVDSVVLPATQYPSAFANKAIAVANSLEPYSTVAVRQDLAVKWLPMSSFYGGRVTVGTYVFGVNLLKDRDLGQRWMVAYVKGVREYLKAMSTKQGQGWDDLVQIIVKYTKMDPKLAGQIEIGGMDPNGLPYRKSMDMQYKWLVDNGVYKGKTTMDSITDLSYIDYATQRLGKQ